MLPSQRLINILTRRKAKPISKIDAQEVTDGRRPMKKRGGKEPKSSIGSLDFGHYYLPVSQGGTDSRASAIRNLSQHSQSNSQAGLTVTNCYRSVDDRRSRHTFGIFYTPNGRVYGM